jgi:hypothetical protein
MEIVSDDINTGNKSVGGVMGGVLASSAVDRGFEL